MSRRRQDFDDAILAELRARLALLRTTSYEDLVRLPDAKSDEAMVLGKPVTFTVFREPHAEGELLILVRSDKPIFFGIGTSGKTEGFWALPTGEKREAYGDEISEFFG